MELNNQNFKKFCNDFNKVLADFGKEHGLELSISNISFNNNSFSTKLTGYNIENGKSSDQIKYKNTEIKQKIIDSFNNYEKIPCCDHGGECRCWE